MPTAPAATTDAYEAFAGQVWHIRRAATGTCEGDAAVAGLVQRVGASTATVDLRVQGACGEVRLVLPCSRSGADAWHCERTVSGRRSIVDLWPGLVGFTHDAGTHRDEGGGTAARAAIPDLPPVPPVPPVPPLPPVPGVPPVPSTEGDLLFVGAGAQDKDTCLGVALVVAALRVNGATASGDLTIDGSCASSRFAVSCTNTEGAWVCEGRPAGDHVTLRIQPTFETFVVERTGAAPERVAGAGRTYSQPL